MNHSYKKSRVSRLKVKVPSAFSLQPLAFLFLILLLVGWVGPGAAWAGTSAQTEAKPKIESTAAAREVVTPKSVFIDDPQIGRDPFFPTSTRRAARIVVRTNTALDPQTVPLTVKLILVGQNKKLVQINNRSFEPGEQAEVLAGGLRIKLTCLEIREKSVLVNVEGAAQPRELFIKPR